MNRRLVYACLAALALTGAAGCSKKDPLDSAAPPASPEAAARPQEMGGMKRLPGANGAAGMAGAGQAAPGGAGMMRPLPKPPGA